MLRLLSVTVLLAIVSCVTATDCDGITSQSDCTSSSCAWCTSGAVGDSCVSPEDAAALPSAVFSCSTGAAVENYHFLATSSCESVSSEDKCTSTSGCSWCDSAAVGSSCMSSSDASALPAAVFTCKDASVSADLNDKLELNISLGGADKCCDVCPDGTDKYYSIPKFFKNNCGESCIAPADVDTIHKLEPGLLLADSPHPCADRGFTYFVESETHSLGPVSAELDMYTNQAPSKAEGDYSFMAATDCDGITSQSDCTSSSCAWCTSGAVGDSCVSPEDAAALPSAVFSCSTGAAVENYHFLATSSCESVSSEDKCTSTSGCSWCDSAAVGSSCMSSSDASALPAAVFTCKDASVSKVVNVVAAPIVASASAYAGKVDNACDCGTGSFCCNTCDTKKGGCTCSTDNKCPAGVGALRGAEGYEYVMQSGEVVLTAPTDYLSKSLHNEAAAPSLGSSSGACSTAGYLRKAGFPENTIGTMVCIAKWESSFNCGATNKNADGSTDYGLFEINSYYWCSGDEKSKYNECNTSCSSLMDCQTNANCALHVYKEQGYNAWYGYQYHKAECDAAAAPSC